MAVSTKSNDIKTSALTPLQQSRLPIVCETCGGCGKVCDKEGKPWSRFQKARNPEVHAGLIAPVVCPTCGGAGITTNEESAEPAPETEPAPAPTPRAPLPKQAQRK